MWGDPVKEILDNGRLFCEQVEKDSHSRTLNILLSGIILIISIIINFLYLIL